MKKSDYKDNIFGHIPFNPLYYVTIISKAKKQEDNKKNIFGNKILALHNDPIDAYLDYQLLMKEISSEQKESYDYFICDSFGKDIYNFCERLYNTPKEKWLSVEKEEPVKPKTKSKQK